MSLVDDVRTAIHETLVRLAGEGALGERGAIAVAESRSTWVVERPKRAEHGDFATNVAMVLTKKVGMPPRAVAEKLVSGLAGNAVVASADIAGPGFVNLRLHPSAVHAALQDILRASRSFGRAPSASGERVNVEFVSANPTGPITVAAARNGILGDAISRLLEATGNRVTREFYVNDFGNQVQIFAESVRAAHEGRARVEGMYQGAYVEEIARYLEQRTPDPFAQSDADLARTCITTMLHGIPGSKTLPGVRRTLGDLGIHFDVWFSEESLHRWGNVEVGLAKLRSGGHLVDKDGATWFVVSGSEKDEAKPGADKDRVVRKTDGAYTYFASDIAYHSDKLSRGYDRLIDVWGADHHGYIPRMKNVLDALGLPSERFEVVIYQLVNILRGGEVVKSSKRAGNVVTADEVMDEIDEAAGRDGAGRDALRFFFLSRSSNSTVDFDLELAKKKSLDNPVFYVQYGHARLASILRKAEGIGFGGWSEPRPEAWSALSAADELSIGLLLARWPAVLTEAATLREPHRIVFYLQELAREFQSYFTRNKTDPILPPDSVRADAAWTERWDHDKTAARLAWVRAIRSVYASALEVLGISAPDRMDLPVSDAAEEEGRQP
jgi:arginyl-tRNA synthetase